MAEALLHNDGGSPDKALLVDSEGQEVCFGTDKVQRHHDQTAHPCIVALRMTCEKNHLDRLPEGFTLYTLEKPCEMCL